MPPEVTIRPCVEGDLPTATAFLRQLYAARPADARLDELPGRLSAFALVAESAAGEVVGLLLAEERATRNLRDEMGRDAFPDDTQYLEVQDLFVATAHRGQGIGTALVRAALDRAAAAGVRRSMVYSANADYARIARFYERCGFRMWHIFMTR